MKYFFSAAIAVFAAQLPLQGQAHHSAAEFDLSIRDQQVTGIVKEFKATNPHTQIVLEVSDEKGTRDIYYEGHSRNNYYRSGWRVGMVKPGDRITLLRAPRSDGGDGGYVLAVTLEDGTRF